MLVQAFFRYRQRRNGLAPQDRATDRWLNLFAWSAGAVITALVLIWVNILLNGPKLIVDVCMAFVAVGAAGGIVASGVVGWRHAMRVAREKGWD
jgi:hypothetical protein